MAMVTMQHEAKDFFKKSKYSRQLPDIDGAIELTANKAVTVDVGQEVVVVMEEVKHENERINEKVQIPKGNTVNISNKNNNNNNNENENEYNKNKNICLRHAINRTTRVHQQQQQQQQLQQQKQRMHELKISNCDESKQFTDCSSKNNEIKNRKSSSSSNNNNNNSNNKNNHDDDSGGDGDGEVAVATTTTKCLNATTSLLCRNNNLLVKLKLKSSKKSLEITGQDQDELQYDEVANINNGMLTNNVQQENQHKQQQQQAQLKL